MERNGWSSSSLLLVFFLIPFSCSLASASCGGESGAMAAAAGAGVLKMGRFQVGGLQRIWLLKIFTWQFLPSASSVCLVVGFAVSRKSPRWSCEHGALCRYCLHPGQRLP